jgi:mycoredoxin
MRIWTILLILGGFFALQHRSDIQNWIHPPVVPTLPADVRVVLYGAEWCGYCAQTRKWLDARKIPYREYDIEKSSEGAAQYQQLNGNGIPLLVIGKQVVRGFDEQAFAAALSNY